MQPGRVERFAAALAGRVGPYGIDLVCGPLVEGAFVGLMVASQLAAEFCYTERQAPPQTEALYPVEYRLPPALRGRVRGKRVAIVNDVTNAGSAVRGTLADLQACGARLVAIGSLLVLGDAASRFAAENRVPLETLATLPNALWAPSDCPLCAAHVPLEDLTR
jgi:orotate phosphoribosyltransferase